MAPEHKVLQFVEAMKKVYGDFDSLDKNAASTWTPPEEPGAGGHRGRYLWTDAFGVINFITLAREKSSGLYLTLAKQLVRRVHDVLGRTRDGTARLPGATDEEPLKGGLRIGKHDETGHDCDGQYHHYLTVWMYALNRLALATGEKEYNELAVQLARAVHPHFIVRGAAGGRPERMVWKVSTDLRTVLVHSEGALDAATGFVIYRLLHRAGVHMHPDTGNLSAEINDYRYLTERKPRRAGRDPLTLGMGLWMCHFVVSDTKWAVEMAGESMETARLLLDETNGLPARDASRRLAFREFGVCLGLHCMGTNGDLKKRADSLVAFWQDCLDKSTDEDLWPISRVMYAAALIPGAWREEYVGLG